MKAPVIIVLLVILLTPGWMITVVNLFGTKRHITVQFRHEHGAIIINSKKVRVPYTLQETAIPTQVDGAIEFLFLDDNRICFVTAFTESIMGLLLVFIYCINTSKGRLPQYRGKALKTLFLTLIAFILSEICSHYVHTAWLIDVKNGVNGHTDLFGVNATFLNIDPGSLILDYQPDIQLLLIPLIALVVLIVMQKEEEEIAYNPDGANP